MSRPPAHKVIPTGGASCFVVDGFQFAQAPQVAAWFLTHAHSGAPPAGRPCCLAEIPLQHMCAATSSPTPRGPPRAGGAQHSVAPRTPARATHPLRRPLHGPQASLERRPHLLQRRHRCPGGAPVRRGPRVAAGGAHGHAHRNRGWAGRPSEDSDSGRLTHKCGLRQQPVLLLNVDMIAHAVPTLHHASTTTYRHRRRGGGDARGCQPLSWRGAASVPAARWPQICAHGECVFCGCGRGCRRLNGGVVLAAAVGVQMACMHGRTGLDCR